MAKKSGSLGFWNSLLFITDPAQFQLAVENHSDPQQDCTIFLGPRRGTIIKNTALGALIIESDCVGILDGKNLGSFTGQSSVLIVDGEAHKESSRVAKEFAHRLRQSQAHFQKLLTSAIQKAVKGGDEMAHVLRHQLLFWAISGVISPDNAHRVEEAVSHASTWLEKANCKALFLPFLRLGKQWREMKRFKKLLVEALGYTNDELRASQALTIILGVVDNPVALTLAALYLANQKSQRGEPIDIKAVVEEALRTCPPIPYTVREVLKTFTIIDPQTGQPRTFPKGHGLLIPGFPFGHGAHKCIGSDLGKMIAKVVLQAFPFETHSFEAADWGRVRFAVGYTEGYAV